MLGALNQKALHDRTLRFHDRALRGSIFPLFNDLGQTEALMVTSTEDDQLIVVDYDPALMAKRLTLGHLRRQRIATARNELLQRRQTTEEALSTLWHFDPWWELADARYAGHSLVPALKATNLPGYDATIEAVWFDFTLSRVVRMAILEPGTGQNPDGSDGPAVRRKKFQPDLLHAAADKRQEAAAIAPQRNLSRPLTSEWMLRPFWES